MLKLTAYKFFIRLIAGLVAGVFTFTTLVWAAPLSLHNVLAPVRPAESDNRHSEGFPDAAEPAGATAVGASANMARPDEGKTAAARSLLRPIRGAEAEPAVAAAAKPADAANAEGTTTKLKGQQQETPFNGAMENLNRTQAYQQIIVNVAKDINNEVQREHGGGILCVAAYIGSSMAENRAIPGSDFDGCVFFQNLSKEEVEKYRGRLRKELRRAGMAHLGSDADWISASEVTVLPRYAEGGDKYLLSLSEQQIEAYAKTFASVPLYGSFYFVPDITGFPEKIRLPLQSAAESLREHYLGRNTCEKLRLKDIRGKLMQEWGGLSVEIRRYILEIFQAEPNTIIDIPPRVFDFLLQQGYIESLHIPWDATVVKLPWVSTSDITARRRIRSIQTSRDVSGSGGSELELISAGAAVHEPLTTFGSGASGSTGANAGGNLTRREFVRAAAGLVVTAGGVSTANSQQLVPAAPQSLSEKIAVGPGEVYTIPDDRNKWSAYLDDAKQRGIKKLYICPRQQLSVRGGQPYSDEYIRPSCAEFIGEAHKRDIQVFALYRASWWGTGNVVTAQFKKAFSKMARGKRLTEKERQVVERFQSKIINETLPAIIDAHLKNVEEILHSGIYDGIYSHLEPYWVFPHWSQTNINEYLRLYDGYLNRLRQLTRGYGMPLMVNSWTGAVRPYDIGLPRFRRKVVTYNNAPLIELQGKHADVVNIWFQLTDHKITKDEVVRFIEPAIERFPVMVTVEGTFEKLSPQLKSAFLRCVREVKQHYRDNQNFKGIEIMNVEERVNYTEELHAAEPAGAAAVGASANMARPDEGKTAAARSLLREVRQAEQESVADASVTNTDRTTVPGTGGTGGTDGTGFREARNLMKKYKWLTIAFITLVIACLHPVIFYNVRPLFPTFYLHEFIHGSWTIENLDIPQWARFFVSRPLFTPIEVIGHSISRMGVYIFGSIASIMGGELAKAIWREGASVFLPGVVDVAIGLSLLKAYLAQTKPKVKIALLFSSTGYFIFHIWYLVINDILNMGNIAPPGAGDYAVTSRLWDFYLSPVLAKVVAGGFVFVSGYALSNLGSILFQTIKYVAGFNLSKLAQNKIIRRKFIGLIASVASVAALILGSSSFAFIFERHENRLKTMAPAQIIDHINGSRCSELKWLDYGELAKRGDFQSLIIFFLQNGGNKDLENVLQNSAKEASYFFAKHLMENYEKLTPRQRADVIRIAGFWPSRQAIPFLVKALQRENDLSNLYTQVSFIWVTGYSEGNLILLKAQLNALKRIEQESRDNALVIRARRFGEKLNGALKYYLEVEKKQDVTKDVSVSAGATAPEPSGPAVGAPGVTDAGDAAARSLLRPIRGAEAEPAVAAAAAPAAAEPGPLRSLQPDTSLLAPVRQAESESLCVTADTLLPIVAVSGKRFSQTANRKPLTETMLMPIIAVKPGDYVLSLDEARQTIEPHRIKGLLDMGVKPVYRLTTASGRSIKTTANHPYLVRTGDTVSGERLAVSEERLAVSANRKPQTENRLWIKVSELKVGDEIGVPKDNLSSAVGVFSGVNAVNDNVGAFNIKTDTVLSDSKSMSSRRQVDKRFGERQRVAGGNPKFNLFNNAFLQLYGKFVKFAFAGRSELKPFDTHIYQTIPIWCLIFSKGTSPNFLASSMPFLSRAAKAGFIGRCVSMASMSQPTGLWYTYSLGGAVSSNLASKAQSKSHNEYVSNKKYLGAPFLSVITAALKSLEISSSFGMLTNFFNISNLTGSFAVNLIKDLDFIFLYPPCGIKHNTPSLILSRLFSIRQAEAAQVIEGSASGGSIFWDKIVSIKPVGYEHVYDIEVDGTHNFIANGIFAHNTYIQATKPATAPAGAAQTNSGAGTGSISPAGIDSSSRLETVPTEKWVDLISDAIILPDPKSDENNWISFGRFADDYLKDPLKYQPHYISATLDASFVKEYDNQEDRYVYDKATGHKYDKRLKVELPGDFTARFVCFKEYDSGEEHIRPLLGVVIHKGDTEVARLALGGYYGEGTKDKTGYEIAWVAVKDNYRKKGIASILFRTAVAIAQKDSNAGMIIAIPDNPASLIALWDLGFQWDVGTTPEGSPFAKETFQEGKGVYMNMIHTIIERARKEQDPNARRRIYRYLCNGKSNPKMGIVNESGIRFATDKDENDVRHGMSDGRMQLDLSLTREDAIKERSRAMRLPSRVSATSAADAGMAGAAEIREVSSVLSRSP